MPVTLSHDSHTARSIHWWQQQQTPYRRYILSVSHTSKYTTTRRRKAFLLLARVSSIVRDDLAMLIPMKCWEIKRSIPGQNSHWHDITIALLSSPFPSLLLSNESSYRSKKAHSRSHPAMIGNAANAESIVILNLLGEKGSAKLHFQVARHGSGKSTEKGQEMKNAKKEKRKKTTLPTPAKIHSRCSSLLAFFHLMPCFWTYFLQVHHYLKWSFAEASRLVSVLLGKLSGPTTKQKTNARIALERNTLLLLMETYAFHAGEENFNAPDERVENTTSNRR